MHIVGILPDGRSSGETDTGRVAKEKQEYSEGDLERIGRAKRQAEVALAAIENGGGDARARKLFTNPTNTIAMLRNERAALVAIGQQAVVAPIERSMLIAALDAAAGREKPAKQEPPTLLAKKEKEKLGVMELGLKEGEKEVGDLVVYALLDTEGLLPWYQKLPEAGQKAFRAVWRGGKYASGQATESEWEVGKIIFDHANRDISLAFAKAYAEHPEEMGEFAGVARQTYVVSGGEYASNGELMPAGPGGGNFTWGEMFGWLDSIDEENKMSDYNLDDTKYQAALNGIGIVMAIANNSDKQTKFSYYVSRPLQMDFAGKFASHNFVVTDAEYLGDPNALVHSFGVTANGKLGRVDENSTGFSEGTHQDDIDAWKSLLTGTDPKIHALQRVCNLHCVNG